MHWKHLRSITNIIDLSCVIEVPPLLRGLVLEGVPPRQHVIDCTHCLAHLAGGIVTP